VNTFLPLADLKASAEVLDYRRLGKQRVEARQLINTLVHGGGWANHPATHMWSQNLSGLMRYHDICIDEWVRRGYRNTMQKFGVTVYSLPKWFGDEEFHSSHRAALLHKNHDFYRRYDWREKPELNYAWPSFVQ
jgi:hypothetical protein